MDVKVDSEELILGPFRNRQRVGYTSECEQMGPTLSGHEVVLWESRDAHSSVRDTDSEFGFGQGHPSR